MSPYRWINHRTLRCLYLCDARPSKPRGITAFDRLPLADRGTCAQSTCPKLLLESRTAAASIRIGQSLSNRIESNRNGRFKFKSNRSDCGIPIRVSVNISPQSRHSCRAFNCRILYTVFICQQSYLGYCYLVFHHPLTLSFQA